MKNIILLIALCLSIHVTAHNTDTVYVYIEANDSLVEKDILNSSLRGYRFFYNDLIEKSKELKKNATIIDGIAIEDYDLLSYFYFGAEQTVKYMTKDKLKKLKLYSRTSLRHVIHTYNRERVYYFIEKINEDKYSIRKVHEYIQE